MQSGCFSIPSVHESVDRTVRGNSNTLSPTSGDAIGRAGDNRAARYKKVSGHGDQGKTKIYREIPNKPIRDTVVIQGVTMRNR